MTSFNHYALGAVADWLHRTVAGLAPDAPGYRRIRIAPRPLARARARARRGTTRPTARHPSRWHREGSSIVVERRGAARTPRRSSTCPGASRSRSDRAVTGGVRATVRRGPFAGPFHLDSSTASVIDDPRAYRALIDAIEHHDPAQAEAVRRETVWAHGRTRAPVAHVHAASRCSSTSKRRSRQSRKARRCSTAVPPSAKPSTAPLRARSSRCSCPASPPRPWRRSSATCDSGSS